MALFDRDNPPAQSWLGRDRDPVQSIHFKGLKQVATMFGQIVKCPSTGMTVYPDRKP